MNLKIKITIYKMINLILVHLGKTFPYHIFDCIEQIRIFNSNDTLNLHLLVQTDVYNKINNIHRDIILSYNVILVNVDELEITEFHKYFNQHTILNKEFRNGFWHFCTERFLSIYDYVLINNLTNIIHIEYDNLIFIDLSKIINVLETKYQCAGVFDTYTHGIPSFVYFKNIECIEALINFMKNTFNIYDNDMSLLEGFRRSNTIMKRLPVLTTKYLDHFHLNHEFANNIDLFNVLFDARAIGQYIGGIDPRNEPYSGPGYINPDALFRVDQINVEWRLDKNNLYIPYACGLPVVNLHIHSKNLRKWLSNRDIKYNKDLIISGERLVKTLENCEYIKLDYITNNFNNKNIVLSHNSDINIDTRYENYINNSKLWLGQNKNINNNKVICVPIGIANSEWKHGDINILSKIMNKKNKKNKLCYFGFSEHTNIYKRPHIKNVISNNNPELEWKSPNLPYDEYLNTLSEYIFAICPPGNGLDTHRMWECLNLKVVPIVERNHVTECFEHLGLLIVDDWNIITKEYLENYIIKHLQFNELGIVNLDFYKNITNNYIKN